MALVLGLPASIAAAAPAVLAGVNEDFLQREPQTTPADLSDNELDGLTDGDPTSGLAQTLPPEPNSGGGAELSYPLEIPKGRGLTPELNLEYASGGGNSWAGYGWSFGVGDISVDTTYGVPLFCPRTTAPKCGGYESESYLLNGEPLMPTAVRTDLQKRVPERQDFTRKQETQYEHIIRHGDGPSNYWWEVRDKMGNISWYGGYPDGGGPFGDPGVRGETDPVLTDDRSKADSAILTDGSGHSGNDFRWYLKAQRDVGVNMIRYEYDTVQYKGTGTTNKGITWTKLTGPNATCTGLCAKHIYLSHIFYTGAAEASGQPFEQPEDPAYEVRLIRASDRRDAILDARGGFLDLDSEQLTRIEVWYTKTNKLAVAYDLNYEPGAFGKTMLASVTQVGCPNGSNCKSSESTNGILRAKHTFDYYDDRGAAGDGFTTDVPWTTGKDDLEGLEGRASALGMSSTNGGDGKVYIGFNPTAPSKMGSFGGSVSFDGADTESKVEMLDINGDSLPDKLFRKNGVIKYRLNTSKTATFGDLTKPVTFTDPIDFKGADTNEHAPPGMPKESSFGVTGGVEVYFGINVMFNAGGNWSWTSGYFTDVNGDGLPDFTDPSSSEVWFNHLECPTLPPTGLCKPLFTKNDSSKTRLPLNVRAVNSTDDTTLQQTIERLKRLSPPIDTVRRWVAPYDGRVRINSTATIPGSGNATPATCATGGVRLAIQHEEEQLRVCSVSANESWHFDTNSIPNALWVLKGDAVYFRVGPDLDVLSTKVDWDPQISYLAYGTQSSSTPASGTAQDVNGLSQRNYSASSDFTLAGRPGRVGMPDGGTVLFSGRLNKTATTTDDVRPTITHTPGNNPNQHKDEPVTVTPVLADGTTDAARAKSVSQNQQGKWCLFVGQTQRGCFDVKADANALLQVIFGDEIGLYDVTASMPVAAPVKNTDGAITAQDVLENYLAIDSPVDVRTLSWVTIPRLCYQDPTGSGCKTNGAEINPPVDTDVYPSSSDARPRAATVWSDNDRTVTVHTTFDVSSDHEPGPVAITIKAAGGTLKRIIDVKATDNHVDHSFDFDIKKDTAYWYDVSVRNPALAEHISDVNVELKWEESQVGHTEDVPEVFNQTGRQGWFGLGWRGWGVAGYRGDSNRRTERIDQSKFDLSKGGDPFDNKDEACKQLFGGNCDSQTANPTFPGSYSSDYGSGGPGFDEKSVDSKVSEVYAFTPTRTIPTGTTIIQQTWTGPKAEMNASATGLEASRLGSQIPEVPRAGSSNLIAPILQGKTSPSLAVSLGAGPAMVSGAFGWSNSSVDYMDMNGDGFPDVVKKDNITFTDPRGGKGCRVSDTSLEECSGGGVEAVDEDTTINVGGGLSGAPVAVKANAKGKTVSTKGGSASKGGPANKGQYGAEVGAGASVGFSWASPMGKDPKWATADFGKVPGNPVDDTGAVKQRMLADINGDGLPDQVKVTTAGVFVRFNLGYTFTSSDDWVLWADASGFESGESGEGAFEIGVGFSTPGREFSGGVSRNASVDYPRFTWTDVNGDGTLDALVKTGDITTPGEVKVAFGTGAGLTGGATYGNNQTLPFQFLGDIKVGTGNQARQDTSIGYGGGFDFTVSFGPLCAVACYLIVNPGAHFEHSETTTDVDLTDVNGDGFADSIRRETADRSIQVRLNKQFRTGLLKTVHNPLGGSFDIDYERKGNTPDHPSSTWVMSKLMLHDGRPDDGVNDRTSTFAYDNDELKFDFVHRRDLGFSRVVTRELAEDGNTVLRATRERFLNDNVLDAGLNTSVELFDGDVSDANLVQRTTQTWSIPDGETGLPVDYAALSTDEKLKAWSTPLLRRVDDKQFAKGTFPTASQETATAYDYDSLGNPSTVRDLGDLSTPSDDLIATVIYTNCEIAASDELAELCGKGDASNQPPFWNPQVCPTWTNIPAIITVRSADGTVLRHRDGSQDLCDNSSVTLLKELISGPINGGEYAETELTYDDWGSYDRIVYPLGANGRHYAVHYEYDDTNGHANVAQVTDYELLPDEVGRFMDGPVGAGGDLPDGGGEAWLAGKVSGLSGNTFTLSIADDPSPVDVDVELSGSAPAWLANGADAVAFGTLADDHSTLSDAKVYRDFSEPWGKNGGPPLEADSVGLTSISTFDPLSGQVASRTDPNGNKTTYSYDVLRRLSSIVTADNGRVDYTYHLTNPPNPPLTADSYALAKHSDAFRPGDTIDTAVLVDGLGRTIQRKHEVDLFSGLNGSPANQLAVTDTVKFDALGRETFTQLPVTQALAGLTSYRTIQSGEAGTARAFDFLDRVTSETKPDGRVTSTAYGFTTDLGTSLTTAEVTDPMKRKTKTFIDTRGFVRAVDDIAVDHLNGTQPVYRARLRTLYDNDPLGNLVDVSQADRTQVHNTYDLLGRRTSTATEDGGLTTYGYDSSGNQVSKQTAAQRADSETHQTTYDYSFGNLVHIEYPEGTPDVTMQWGGLNGAPSSANGAGRLVDVTDGARHQTLGYDVHGNVNTEADEMLDDHWKDGTLTTRWSYDWLGRARTMTYPDGETVTNDYDRGGLLSKVSGAKACTQVGTLSASVNLTQTTITVQETPHEVDPTPPFTIKVDGETMQVTNRVAQPGSTGVFTYTVVRGFGGSTITTHANGASVTSTSGLQCSYRYVDRLEYDKFGAPQFQQVGNRNRTQYFRNALNRRLDRQETVSPQQGSRVQQNLTYTYDDADNVTKYVDELPADTSALMGGKVTQNYRYDPYYRILHGDGLWETAPKTDRHYAYDLTYDDPTGNVKTKTQRDWENKAGCTSNCNEFVFDATTYSYANTYDGGHQHRVAQQGGETLTYDPNGNVTSILHANGDLREMNWNDDGRMTMIVDRPNGTGGKPTSYTYDMNGQLAIEDKEQGRSWFVNPYVTVKSGTMWKNIVAGDDRVGVKASQQDVAEQKLYFLHKDLQGSTNIVTDSTGRIFQHHEYFPSGEVWVDEKSTVFRTPYQFAGEYNDEDHGMLDLGERWYDPRRERMPSVDAAVADDPTSLVDDQTIMAAYSFTGSNPLSYFDPDGRERFLLTRLEKQSVALKLVDAGFKREELIFTGFRAEKVGLEPGGITPAVTKFFDKHDGLGARLGYFVLTHYKGLAKLQSFSEKIDTPPLVEFEFDFTKAGWKMKKVRNQKVKLLGKKVPPRKTAGGKSGSKP